MASAGLRGRDSGQLVLVVGLRIRLWEGVERGPESYPKCGVE